MSPVRELRFRWATTCSGCGTALAVGSAGWWHAATKSSYCVACGDRRSVADAAVIDGGTAGASARREHDRRAGRERQRQQAALEADARQRAERTEQRPVLGRIRNSLTPKPQMSGPSRSTRAWATGADGEERVAAILSAVPGLIALHDRRIPGSKANINHIAVTTAGVFVIDAKKYKGEIKVRDVGPLWRTERRLYVGGRNQTKLIDGLRRQMAVVQGAVDSTGHEVRVYGILCFVGAEWPLVFRRPLSVDGVAAVWPSGLPDVMSRVDVPAPIEANTVAGALADLLPPA
jgi:hypothetical protein